MSFLDGGFATTPFGNIGAGFGGSGIAGGNPGPPSGIGFGSGGFGSSSSKSGGPGPGFVSPFDQQVVGNALNTSMDAMVNRYAQLGLSGQGATPSSPGGPAGGIGVGNIGSGMQPNQGAEPTAEQMDLGQIPTLTGGLPGEAEAVIGQIQNANLQTSGGGGSGGGGKGGGGKGAIGAVAPLLMAGGK